MSAAAIRRHASASVDIPVELQRSIQYLCRRERGQVITAELEGVPLDGSIGSFRQMKDAMWFATKLERYTNLSR